MRSMRTLEVAVRFPCVSSISLCCADVSTLDASDTTAAVVSGDMGLVEVGNTRVVTHSNFFGQST